MICKYCGVNNNENRQTCKGCGQQLYEYTYQQAYNNVMQQVDLKANNYYSNNMQYQPKKKKNILLLVCIAVGAVSVLTIIVAVLLLNFQKLDRRYTAKLLEADKYYAEADYDTAIKIYNEAIEINPKDPDAYIKLANVYIIINDIENAKKTVRLGLEYGENVQLRKMLNSLLGTSDASVEENLVISVNTQLLNYITGKNYNEFVSNYGEALVNVANGYAKVKFSNLGVEVYYTSSVVDINTNQPLENAMSSYVIVTEPEVFITNYSGYLSVSTIAELFKASVQVDMTDGVQCAIFDYLGCRISIQCDNSGNIVEQKPYIKIVPLSVDYVADMEGQKGTATGIIIDASTKSVIVNAHITVRSGANVKSGTVVAEVDTNNKGEYSVYLLEGKYTMCVSQKNYPVQYFNITVNKGMTMANQNYELIKDNSASSEIKIVLEWGSNPADLDLHIQGRTPLGQHIGVFGYGGRWTSVTENGKVVADLDHNATSGNGTETIKIYGEAVNGEYQIHVHDQTNRDLYESFALSKSGAVLKIYLPGETTPHIYNVPTNEGGTCWYPCRISGQKITIPSSGTMRYSTIG